MPSTIAAPRAEQPRSFEIKVRFTPEEMRLVRGGAASARRYVSEYVRMAALSQVQSCSEPGHDVA